ncbi:hypothetical protein CASFOL_010620 [Castilleja foliolosa]|uniref:Uncharacterized protein n=1 Tax=Castilleja foliolosa TaxID=1961234 RepID=A0ABD3DT79_9LAMI
MEIDEGGESGGGKDGGASVEMGKNNTPDGEPKLKRKMKTPSQLDILEKTYALETYPAEALRAELSVKLGLSDRQLQMWFCHRRLKDRKAPPEKKQKKNAPSSAVAVGSSVGMHEKAASDADVVNGGGSGLSLYGNTDPQHKKKRVGHKVGTAVPRISIESPPVRRSYEPPLAISEQRAIRFVEVQLGEPLREDGPILGMEFDPFPPGAFGAPIVSSEQKTPAGWSCDPRLYEGPDANSFKRNLVWDYPSYQGASRDLQEYQFLPQKPSARNDAYEMAPSEYYNARVSLRTARSIIHSDKKVPPEYLQSHMPSPSVLPQQSMAVVHLSPAPREVDDASILNANMDSHLLVHPITALDDKYTTPERRIVLDQERLERKRKSEEVRIAKEVEVHEKRIRKELEKQDILRKRREEQMRKEMERLDRERRKEEERMFREKQREEERCQREQRREMERREKFLQREYIRAEKMRIKEEMRREKEAARLKAANDRANARRVAKESTELIDDERLELMELAALSKNLPSVLALDTETLLDLDVFRDKLPDFPPESVRMKRPFRVQPWTDSEENVSNLLMVWRFLITFADVLGLWPFTLDEFTQALHDSDPRLLGEIHIALLRSIIKDIENVVRTPNTAMMANQSSAINPVGGHPHIVEGAYNWGFDLLSWQRLLTPLTWPEVLRQFALSAGFGPKLKKQNMKSAHLHDENECNGGAEMISNLRSGVAAENAVAIMQERGLSNPRRSRHRLTPGTVKYAAFHILSLEGSKGLSILDVADKIQTSRLRDLTTSKTPEASISAALSRDTKLFERIAPSTYCVRSPYRKDPANADEIISAARDKIRLFQNGSVEEDAEKEELESDDADDPDADELDAVTKIKEIEKGSLTLSQSVGEIKNKGEITICDIENIVSDECGSGEPWIRGLTEGEYADLSTEERLNAIVALIVVANEGNSIRVALEERLEAANALKKQMWDEAQLDKRRMKYESLSMNPHFTVEHRRSPLTSVYVKNESSSKNPVFHMVDLNDQQNEENYFNRILTEKNPSVQESYVVSDNMLIQKSSEKSRSQLKAIIGHRAEEIHVYRSLPLGQDRRRNRYWQFMTSPSRNDPGSGKIYVELCNGVWRLVDSEEAFDALLSSLDGRGIREYHLQSMLQNIGPSFKEAIRKNLLSSNSGVLVGEDTKMNVPEIRHKLDSYSNSPGPSTSPFIELENNGTEKNELIDRYTKDFEWLWKECFDSNVLGALKYGTLRCERLLEICKCCRSLFSCEDYHCSSCHWTYKTSEITFDIAEHVRQCETKRVQGALLNLSFPPRIRLLKAQLALIEASIPSDALKPVWSDEYRKSWGRQLNMASTAEELLQSLTMLEDNIKKEFLSENYETTSEMLSSCEAVGESFSRPEAVPVLPWIPRTTPAVSLRLMELDLSIYYTSDQKTAHQKESEAGHFVKFPSICSGLGSSMNNTSLAATSLQQDNCFADTGNGLMSLKRGRGRPRGPSRTRGGKSQKKAIDSLGDASNLTTTKSQRKPINSRSFLRGSTKKGRRSVANRRKPATRAVGNVVEKRGAKDKMVFFDDTPNLQQGEWNLAETEIAGIAGSSSETSESDNDYDDVLVRSEKSEQYTENVEYEIDDDDEPVEDLDDDYNYDVDGDNGMGGRDDGYYDDDGYIDNDYNNSRIRSGGKVDRSPDEDSSSEYSY